MGSVAGVVIGLTLAFVHIMGIPLTGISVNPARSLAPAIFMGGQALEQVWLFIAAPLVGAALAALVWVFLIKARRNSLHKEETKQVPCEKRRVPAFFCLPLPQRAGQISYTALPSHPATSGIGVVEKQLFRVERGDLLHIFPCQRKIRRY